MTATPSDQLELMSGNWYGYQMLPGYGAVPYLSPIYVESVTPKKTGRGILGVEFVNLFYAQGVQDFMVDLEILKHRSSYLVANIVDQQDRCVIVSQVSFDWIERFCPNLWDQYPVDRLGLGSAGGVGKYLSDVFRLDRDSHQ